MCKGVSCNDDTPAIEGWQRPYTEGVLTKEELEHYWREGYVVKKDLLTKGQLEPVIESINRCSAGKEDVAEGLRGSATLSHPCTCMPLVCTVCAGWDVAQQHVRWPT